MSALERHALRLHGHSVAYYAAGSGPVVLLIHGITSSADAWQQVIPALAERHTVIAPDLMGHGGSAKPRGGYSLGAYASGLRDLLAALGLASLSEPSARRDFLHTARSILDGTGQRVSATDRLYLAEGMPTLILWGERDPMIPAAHGVAAHALIPHSRLELFGGAGHYPFVEDPERFAAVLGDFVATTEPAVYDEESVRSRLREGAPA